MFKRLSALLGGNKKSPQKTPLHETEKGFLVFHHTGEVIRAEQMLQKAGFYVEIKGPPPDLRTGCDMVIVFPLLKEFAVRRELEKAGLHPADIIPMRGGMLEPVSLLKTIDYGKWIMVQAANVKITVEKASGAIVNVSGGGCPDVPWLAGLMVGQNIFAADEPRINGQSLCSYALQKAFIEARRLIEDGET